jgi:HK97 family phage portal protein
MLGWVKKKIIQNLSPRELEALVLEYGGGYPEASSGERVSPETAMRTSAVYSCVGLIAETVGMLPLKLYRRLEGGGKEEAADHPLHRMMHRRPNAWQTAMEFREMGTQHLCLRGNFYAFKVTAGGRVRELLPLLPQWVSVEQKEDWELLYTITWGARNGVKRVEKVPAGNVMHIRYRTLDGILGLNPIAYARETIGLAMAAEKHGARLFKNGAKPLGVIKHPKVMTEQAQERFKKNWQEAYSGEGLFKTAILEEGMEYEPLSMSNQDAQFLESRKFQVEDIARIYRVPLPLIQHTEKSTSWGTGIEQLILGFIKFTMLPWFTRWEGTLERDLLRAEEQGSLFFEFLVDGLERGDFKGRYEGYEKAIQNGIMSPNEVRGKENLNPREGGDEYLRPKNIGKDTGKDAGGEPGKDSEGELENE